MRLDIGCGKNKKPDFIGVDQYPMEGVDVVFKIGSEKWPWEDESVEEVHCSHFLEHLTNWNDKWERVHFFNELSRVLKKGAKATIIIPHWSSNRYYGDPTHKEAFSEFGWMYLDKDWRKVNAPHADSEWNPNGYTCDLSATWGYALHPQVATRNGEFQQFAMQFYKEAAQDMHCTIVKK